MKVGDMVQYVDHSSWENSGLGIITDTKLVLSTTEAYQITWLDDIEDNGLSIAIEKWSQWYDEEDMKEDIQLFAEAE